MSRPSEQIAPLAEHPDSEILREFDHPTSSLKRWVGVLTAKAWIGDDLACFFTEAESGAERYVLVFKPLNAGLAGIYGIDMRLASVGSTYLMDVFVTAHYQPIIDRIEPQPSFA
jgi:hypothetical protein